MKYNLKKIMQNAWKIYRANEITFAEALHRAWLSAKAKEVNAKRRTGRNTHEAYLLLYQGNEEKQKIKVLQCANTAGQNRNNQTHQKSWST